MEFSQQASTFLLSIGYIQGATKSTENNFQKGRVEFVIYEFSFIRRKIHDGRIFSQINFKKADLELLKKVTDKAMATIFFGERK